ncbi:hypothetical protein Aduo_000295 [Ancylostoma duodenale]
MSRFLHLTVLLVFIGSIPDAGTVPICGQCLASQVALVAPIQLMTKPTVKMLANTAAGCKRMNVVCTMPRAGMMEFNRATAGPYEGKTITALLTCGADKKWRNSYNGKVTIVNAVACYYV